MKDMYFHFMLLYAFVQMLGLGSGECLNPGYDNSFAGGYGL